MDMLGISVVYYPTPLILASIWLTAKFGVFLEKKTEKTEKSEELVLTTIAVVYAVYDILLFFANFTAFDMVTDGRY